MEKQQTFFKVITKKSRESAFVTNKSIKVHYPVNEWAFPQIKGSRLLVFNNSNSAEIWINLATIRRLLIVVPCECRGIVKPIKGNYLPHIYVTSWHDVLHVKEVKEFWKTFRSVSKKFSLQEGLYDIINIIKRNIKYSSSHQHTIYASSVKCLK